ncbi:DUF4442 domain-containing protein [Legionella impletisoli]|uniref:Tetrameric acyl-CoA thioesterase n=1 Tax=Legionella impletisoli TaxID=343510 RepID=A0A917JX42_9GAMM|nr:DUF4442 domain-containing protein [Legionella impletisoli]GGI88322.1 hypothetical protein GCM10007966_16370 [Legionella impletisoli]
MSAKWLLRLMRFWPPFLGAGIRVKDFKKDYSFILVEMKLRFWNQNYVGAHFGGSLYTMTDPFYMLMLIKQLGKGYVVWDKSAKIRYKKPGRKTVYAKFSLTSEEVQAIKKQVDQQEKYEPIFLITVIDEDGNAVAEIEKTLHIKRTYAIEY